MYSPDCPFLCLIGILHASALRKRKELQDITKKIKRNKTSKISLEFDRNWTLQIIFFKMKIHKILCRNSIISHLIIKVDPKCWSYALFNSQKWVLNFSLFSTNQNYCPYDIIEKHFKCIQSSLLRGSWIRMGRLLAKLHPPFSTGHKNYKMRWKSATK